MAQPIALTTAGNPIGWLDLLVDEFAEALGRSPFQFRHRLDRFHPLLTREALSVRADDWPTKWLEHHQAELPFVLPSGETDQLPSSPGEVVRDIDSNGCWLVLWDTQHSPPYGDLLDECLAPVEALLGRQEGGMRAEA